MFVIVVFNVFHSKIMAGDKDAIERSEENQEKVLGSLNPFRELGADQAVRQYYRVLARRLVVTLN